ncbi:hypothetical protein [Halalkalibacterium ligniniphilum]|uniref:hypothetical protein n=1 Tax=Halalkalibacterium ligniniphilum TaxID=1134413 RepID=UPI000344AA2D|nr:hypothetical protein [Halalkalibacterium ligniniphilum]
MPYFNGQIISGEFDNETNIFSLQKVKSFTTESSLKENQLHDLYNYLKKHEHEKEGQIITLYDQMLVPLTQVELKALMSDLEFVQTKYQQ